MEIYRKNLHFPQGFPQEAPLTFPGISHIHTRSPIAPAQQNPLRPHAPPPQNRSRLQRHGTCERLNSKNLTPRSFSRKKNNGFSPKNYADEILSEVFLVKTRHDGIILIVTRKSPLKEKLSR
jgi:hypothetical protein